MEGTKLKSNLPGTPLVLSKPRGEDSATEEAPEIRACDFQLALGKSHFDAFATHTLVFDGIWAIFTDMSSRLRSILRTAILVLET